MAGERQILVVEDSPTQAESLRDDLEDAGFDVTVAGSGEEALQRLGARAFDLVISDIVMPGIDGYQLCRRIKERDVSVPVVLVTSLTDPLDVVHGLQAGADNFLRKPYDTDQLLSRIRTILHNRHLRESGHAQMGLELFFLNQRFMITADREQMLDLLVTTFEDLVVSNQQLRGREEDLAAAHGELADQLTRTEAERQRLSTVLSAAPDPMVIVDRDGLVIDASDALAAMVGAPSARALAGRHIVDVITFVDPAGERIPDADRPLLLALADGQSREVGTAFDLLVACHDGSRVPVIARAAAVRDRSGRITGAVGVIHEVSGLAAHDPVTSLPTHTAFADRVERALSEAARRGLQAGVIVVALDRFERLRASLGDERADGVVAATARSLRAALSEPDPSAHHSRTSAAYLGNGEFAVVLSDLPDERSGVRVAQSLVDALRKGYRAEDVDVVLTVSVGVVFLTSDGLGVSILVAAARTAARRALERGGDRLEVFDPAAGIRAAESLRDEAELRRAIERGELVVHYQPQLTVATGAAVGVEALVRWHHPERGLLLPAEFIPLAEETGLVVQLGWEVLGLACRQAASWRRALPGGKDLFVSVNLSAQQLDQPDLVNRVRTALAESGLDPDALMLEITETGVMRDARAARAQLEQLKAVGVRLGVDDFGTGYSSLFHLRALPVDVLKIDHAFVRGMSDSDEDATIVAATVRLGRALGLEVVAEGVETIEQLVQLRVLGCDLAQGYHWSRPLPPEVLEAWWDEQASRARARPGGIEPVVELEATEAQRDDIVANLMHELRAPLTTILGYAELAQTRTATEPDLLPRALDAIVRGARDLEGRLTMLSDARAMQAGVINLVPEPTDVGLLAREAVSDVASQLGPHPVVVTAEPGISARLDPARVRQALTNLLSNAAKFSPDGAPIEVAVVVVDRAVEIAVEDQGPGIPPERRPELFRRFSRLGSRTKGMGVGLYLSRLIARASGGELHHEATVGGGSRFVLSLPLGVEHASAGSPRPNGSGARP